LTKYNNHLGAVRWDTLISSKAVYGIEISVDDFKSLNYGNWYTDAIMEVRLTWLQHHYSKNVMFFTAWECTMISGAFPSHSRQRTRLSQLVAAANPAVVVFLRHGGCHWWCEIYDIRNKHVRVVNTLGKCQEAQFVGESARNCMTEIFKGDFVQVPCIVIQQENGNTTDCGPLILWTLDARSSGIESFRSSSSIANIMRADVATRTYVNIYDGTRASRGLHALRSAVFKNPLL
jgi:Ulp1 family protease